MLDVLLDLLPRRHVRLADPGPAQRRGAHLRRRPLGVLHRHHLPDQYAYNSTGELTGVTTPPVTGFPSGRTTSYSYTDGSTAAGGYNGAVPPKGLPYQVTTPGGAVTTTLYYADGDVAQVTDPDGQAPSTPTTGWAGRPARLSTPTPIPNGLTTTYAYDANGHLATETDPAVTNRVTGAMHTAQTTTSYDADGNVTSQTVADLTGGDASRTVTSTYNAYDQLASATDAAGATPATPTTHTGTRLEDRPGRQRHRLHLRR